MFRPSSARHENSQTTSEVKKETNHRKAIEERDVTSLASHQGQETVCSSQYQSTQIKPRRIQSAKGRLERPQDTNGSQTSKVSTATAPVIENKGSDRKTSVLNINAAVDIPDKEEAELILRANIMQRSALNEFNQKQRIRPSSAKSTYGCPISSVETTEKDLQPAKETLKPSVYGLKLGRQVFGNDPCIQEAWADTEKNFPFRLKEETGPKESNRELVARLDI